MARRRPRLAREALAICDRADELIAALNRFAGRYGPAERLDPCDVETRILLGEVAGAVWALEHLVAGAEMVLSAFAPAAGE